MIGERCRTPRHYTTGKRINHVWMGVLLVPASDKIRVHLPTLGRRRFQMFSFTLVIIPLFSAQKRWKACVPISEYHRDGKVKFRQSTMDFFMVFLGGLAILSHSRERIEGQHSNISRNRVIYLFYIVLICSPQHFICSALYFICSAMYLICSAMYLICSALYLIFSASCVHSNSTFGDSTLMIKVNSLIHSLL